MPVGFKTEKDLFNIAMNCDFIRGLLDSDHYLACLVEPKGLFGIPDLVIVEESCKKDKRAFAFEMKLSNWKRALIQAFRYRAFANFSCVFIDHDHVKPAKQNIALFQRSNIGLFSVDQSGRVETHHLPSFDSPYSLHLQSTLWQMAHNGFAGKTIGMDDNSNFGC